jgi:sulfite reductase alpha subunit
MLDQLESGPWPSFVTGLKRLAQDSDMMVDLLGQLETSYRTHTGYWKGGTVGVFGYGGGIIPRFTELKDEHGKPLFPEAAEFHTLRVQPHARAMPGRGAGVWRSRPPRSCSSSSSRSTRRSM